MLKRICFILFTIILISTLLAQDLNTPIIFSTRDAPVLDNILDQDVDEDQIFTYQLSATDLDNDPLTFDANIDGNGTVNIDQNDMSSISKMDKGDGVAWTTGDPIKIP